MTFWYIFVTTGIVALISLVGIFTLSLSDKFLKKILLFLVALSAGALFGGAIFHLIPEFIFNPAVDNPRYAMLLLLLGFVLFFLVEKILHWRHCHKQECDVHTAESFGFMNIIGDTVHNFIDGLVIAAAFSANIGLGISTTLAIALHELPQEIGDFGVLIHSGMEKKKALFLNFAAALTVVLGGIFGYFLSGLDTQIVVYLLPFAAGGFLYISSSDLIPELRKEENIKKWTVSFIIFILGALLMFIIVI